LQSISGLSLLSVGAPESLLSNESLLVDNEDTLLRILIAFRHPALPRHIWWEPVSASVITNLFYSLTCHDCTEWLWRVVSNRMALPPPGKIDSLIVSRFPPLLKEFRTKWFHLLWRGHRDGFEAAQFHHRCERRTNTLTLISGTDGNIFGGFTPVAWESWPFFWSTCGKADPSLKSFVFTLKNPHNFPPTKFPLDPEEQEDAIFCCRGKGPFFCDIIVDDECNTSNENLSCIGCSYKNTTGIGGTSFFTGSHAFTVKEIETFEIARETRAKPNRLLFGFLPRGAPRPIVFVMGNQWTFVSPFI
jgi:hypothetical protein